MKFFLLHIMSVRMKGNRGPLNITVTKIAFKFRFKLGYRS